MDAVLSALISGRSRFWLTGALPGALAFWCLGALALGGISLSVPHTGRCAIPDAGVWCDLSDHAGVRFVAVALLAVAVVIAGTSLVIVLTGPALSVIAGFGWSRGPLGWLARQLTRLHRRRRASLLQRPGHDRGGVAARLAWYPTGDAPIRPTRVGNTLAALGQRVRRRHGLDLPTCWPLVEQILPQSAREELEASSGRVAGRIQNLLWALAALVWLPALPTRLAIGVAVASVILAVLLWWAISGAVEQYCALIEALVAVHRQGMYRAVGWPLPTSTAQEPELGRALTGYLNRLSPLGDVALVWPDDTTT